MHCDNLITETTPHLQRRHTWDAGRDTVFDVAIIGGGIKGAHIYHQLCEAGYRTVLLEKGDFASGTSQASCMMIWGGLLYLANWDIATVWKLSSARNLLLRTMPNCIRQQTFRYYPQHIDPQTTTLSVSISLLWPLRTQSMESRSIIPTVDAPESSPSDGSHYPDFDEAMVGPSMLDLFCTYLRHQSHGHVP
jgi:glycerol-3-phosphate dehydrogenase